MLKHNHYNIEYRTGMNDFIKEFYVPSFEQSVEYWRAVGYFRSSSLEAFGKTLQDFLKNNGTIKLITSVELTEADRNAIEEGSNKQEVCEQRINKIIEEEFQDGIGSGVTRLGKLLEIGRLEIKIAMPKNGRGIFHEKLGIFLDAENNYVAFAGSMNETYNAYEQNYECIEVFTSWKDEERAETKRQKELSK